MNLRRMIIAGGSGFLGQTLARYFLDRSWDVVVLTRSPAIGLAGRPIEWNGRTLGVWSKELDGAAVLVNLAGKSVNCRYHTRNRREILASRVDSTRILGEAIGHCDQAPMVWLNASTATIYRQTFGNAWDEEGAIGATPEAKDSFSVEVALAWERALNEVETARTRKIALRMAMVLGLGKNSVFPMLRRLVRLGLGGRMGSGRQFVSWVHEADYCRAVEWLITRTDIEGVVNLAAPHSVSNGEMMQLLRAVSCAPFGLPASRWMLEAGAFILRTETELIIKSRRVIPGRLLTSGFEFQLPTMSEAFRDLAKRRRVARVSR